MDVNSLPIGGKSKDTIIFIIGIAALASVLAVTNVSYLPIINSADTVQ